VAEQRVVWRRVAFAGCGCLLLVAALAGALVAYNWRAISASLQRNSAAMTELMGIQRTLMQRYGTVDVSARWATGASYSIKHGKGRSGGTRLVVTLVNPPFLNGMELDAAEDKAREIALVVRSGLRDPGAAPNIDIVLAKQVRVGVRVTNRRVFRFSAEDLAAVAATPVPSE
jgi:hypothetical protein